MGNLVNFMRIKLRNKRKKIIIKRTVSFLRLIRRRAFQIIRFLVYVGFRLWLKKIYNSEKLPKHGPAMIVSNHLSYYDWAVLSAIYWDRYLVFIGNQDLLNRPIVRWLMKLNILIFIDPKNPGLGYFKETIRRLKEGHILVIYPEGTRSKSGRMQDPKSGFVKLAIKTGVPIIPLAMCGTYEILPYNKKMPAFRRCEIIVGDPIYLNADNTLFGDLGDELSDYDEKRIALRIMQKIRKMTKQEWDREVLLKYKHFLSEN